MNETEAKPTAEQLLLNACRDAKFRDKWIYPVGGAPHQNWLLQVYVPVPEDAKDRTPEGCLRAVLAAQPAPVPLTDADLQRHAQFAADVPGHCAVVLLSSLRRLIAASPQPAPAEPVALESVHLTRDIKGMCTVRVNGRIAIHDNGDIIDHMATLEWFAQPAPVPLTDLQLSEIAVSDEFLLYCSQDEFNEIARAIERAHGITGGSK